MTCFEAELDSVRPEGSLLIHTVVAASLSPAASDKMKLLFYETPNNGGEHVTGTTSTCRPHR